MSRRPDAAVGHRACAPRQHLRGEVVAGSGQGALDSQEQRPREEARETDYLGEHTTEESIRKPAEQNFGSSGA